MAKFHDRLKELKDEKGVTQTQMAKDLGIKLQTLSYYINNREPNFDLLCKMADYFDVTTDYLLGRTDYKTALTAGVGEILGLRNDVIDKVFEYSRKYETAFSYLLLDNEFEYLLCNLDSYADSAGKAKYSNRINNIIDKLDVAENFEAILAMSDFSRRRDGIIEQLHDTLTFIADRYTKFRMQIFESQSDDEFTKVVISELNDKLEALSKSKNVITDIRNKLEEGVKNGDD